MNPKPVLLDNLNVTVMLFFTAFCYTLFFSFCGEKKFILSVVGCGFSQESIRVWNKDVKTKCGSNIQYKYMYDNDG